MRTFQQAGETITFTAPVGGVTVDVPVLIGRVVVIPTNTVAAGAEFEGMVEGVFKDMPKTDGVGTAWTEGAPVYFDSATSEFTYVQSATARRAGYAVEAAADGAVVGVNKLINLAAAPNVA